jgi:hypothetical protein
MRYRAIAAVVISTAAILATGSTPVAFSLSSGSSPVGNPACTSRLFRTNARIAYQPWYSHVGNEHRLKALKGCAPNAKTLNQMIRIQRNQVGGRQQAIGAYHRLTPYGGPGKTRWAIPYSIVACESGGSWTAANPSGAVGPYQLLGWGAPYPATTWPLKMANHRIASQVYAGGAGRSNWVC